MKLLNQLAITAAVGLAVATNATEPLNGEHYCSQNSPARDKSDVVKAVGDFCSLWSGQVFDQDESIWNTMPLLVGGVAKLNVVYVGTATFQLTSEECEASFGVIFDKCNEGVSTTEGGTYTGELGNVYFILSIDPLADQQTNGTFPTSKQPDLKRSRSAVATSDRPKIFKRDYTMCNLATPTIPASWTLRKQFTTFCYNNDGAHAKVPPAAQNPTILYSIQSTVYQNDVHVNLHKYTMTAANNSPDHEYEWKLTDCLNAFEALVFACATPGTGGTNFISAQNVFWSIQTDDAAPGKIPDSKRAIPAMVATPDPPA